MLKQRSTGGFSQRKKPQNKSSGASLDSMTVGFGSYTPSGWANERAEKKARWQAMAMEDDDSWAEEAQREIAAAKAEVEAEEQERETEHGTRIMTLAELMQGKQIATGKNYKSRQTAQARQASQFRQTHPSHQAAPARQVASTVAKSNAPRYVPFTEALGRQGQWGEQRAGQGAEPADAFAPVFAGAGALPPASGAANSAFPHDPLDYTTAVVGGTAAVGGEEGHANQRSRQSRGSWQQRKGAGAAKNGAVATQVQERDSDVTHAINAMVGLLAQREYGAQELKSKCLRKFTPEAVEQALQHCQERGYQSEERYGQMLIRHMEFSLYGPLRLQMEAQKKKISWELLRELSAETDWEQLAYQALIKKYGITVLDYATQRKALAYLGRRGFAASSCISAMQRMQQEAKEQGDSR